MGKLIYQCPKRCHVNDTTWRQIKTATTVTAFINYEVCPSCCKSAWIEKRNWAIVTIGECVKTNESLTGRSERIRIDEPAGAGIIITALEVVEPGFDSGAMILAI